jgi:cysteinyl-tRNA synthetase
MAIVIDRHSADIHPYKIIQRAVENKEDIYALTNRFIAAMHEDEQALGILPPDIEPRATDAIAHILLEENDGANGV